MRGVGEPGRASRPPRGRTRRAPPRSPGTRPGRTRSPSSSRFSSRRRRPCDRLEPPGAERRHEVVRPTRIGSSKRVAQRPDVAHDVGVAAADATVAVALGLRPRALVLPGAAAAVQRLHDADAGHRPARLVVGEEADVRPARVAGHRDGAAALRCREHERERQVDAREVEGRAAGPRSRRTRARDRSRSPPRSPSGSAGRTRPRGRGSRSRRRTGGARSARSRRGAARAGGSTGSSSRRGPCRRRSASSGCGGRGSCGPEHRHRERRRRSRRTPTRRAGRCAPPPGSQPTTFVRSRGPSSSST